MNDTTNESNLNKELSPDEKGVLEVYREAKEVGFGRVEISVADGKIASAYFRKPFDLKKFR